MELIFKLTIGRTPSATADDEVTEQVLDGLASLGESLSPILEYVADDIKKKAEAKAVADAAQAVIDRRSTPTRRSVVDLFHGR